MAKCTVEFDFSIGDTVKVIPIGSMGVITSVIYNDGGKQYYVETKDKESWQYGRYLELTD